MTASAVQPHAIHVQGLEKSYRQVEVLCGLDIDVARSGNDVAKRMIATQEARAPGVG